MKFIDNDFLIYFGNNKHDYRSLMANQYNIELDNFTIPFHRLIKMEQIAKDIIIDVNENHAGAGFIQGIPEIPQSDGIITKTPNLFLCVRTADCYPVILYDTKEKVIAVAHSGREGTRLNITGKMISKMIQEYHCSTENIKVIVGAGITEAHYELDQQTIDLFYQTVSNDLGLDISSLNEKQSKYLNILNIILLQIYHSNIPIHQVQYIPHCTFEDTQYYSYRRDKTNNRQLSIIGIIS